MTGRKWPLFFWTLVLILPTAWIYAPVLGYQFVSFDDPYLLVNNPIVLNFDWKAAFTQFVADDYLPLVFLSFAVENHFFGMDPGIFHLSNLLLHLANTLLAFTFVFQISQRRFLVAGVSALLFALHPLHVESVAWVAERKDVLFTFFYLLALLAAWRRMSSSQWRWSILTFSFFLLSLFSKLMAVTLPAVLVMLDLYFQKSLKKSLLARIPYFFTSLVFVMVHFHLHSPEGSERGSLSLKNGLDSLAFYLSKTVWPQALSIFYQQGVVTVGWVEYAGLALFGMLIVWLLRRRPSWWREGVLGISFFFVTATPILQVIPFGHKFLFADRLMYLPSLGLFWLFAFGLQSGWAQIQRPWLRGLAGVTALVSILAMAAVTTQRLPVWENSLTLWSDAVDKYPESSVSRNNLASELVLVGRVSEAIEQFQAAIRHDPNYAEPRVGLGLAYSDAGALDLAEKELKKAIDINPQLPKAYFNMAVVADKKQQYQEAVEWNLKALAVDSGFADAAVNLGSAYYKLKDFEKSLAAFEQAVKLNPNLAEAHNNLGYLALEKGEVLKALSRFQEAVRLDPTFDLPRQGLATVYARQGDMEKAQAEIVKLQELRALPKPHRRQAPGYLTK